MTDTYDVFLSGNHADRAAVETVAKRLRDEAGLRPFLDEWHLVPGESFIPALERALEHSRAVAVFFGPNWGSVWRDEETQLALVLAAQDRGKRVIPVLLPGGRKQDVEGFLRLRTWVDLTAEDGFLRLVAGITGQPPQALVGRSDHRRENVEASSPTRIDPPVEVAREVADADAALVAELANVYWDADWATTLVRGAGFPPSLMPAFKTPNVFWASVLEAADNGAIRGGVQALAGAAAKQYPGNAIFVGFGRPAMDTAHRPGDAVAVEIELKQPAGKSVTLEAKRPTDPASGETQAAGISAPRYETRGPATTTPLEYRLSILHISDLHARTLDVDDLPVGVREQRRRQVHREAASRARVLGPAWEKNLRVLYPHGERPDLVCFTGDIADWALPAEYAKATEFIERSVRVLGITMEQVYVVPGNHDVRRDLNADEWRAVRELLPSEAGTISDWLAGGRPPRAVEERMIDAVLQRTAAFWQWVEQALGRPELLPARHSHRRLGFHHVVSLPHLPFEVHVFGLDSAWLAGDGHDHGKLWLTTHQRNMLLYDDVGEPWEGFRLALVHHPLEELAQSDAGATRRMFAETVDLLLHGHQHEPVGSSLIDLDGRTVRALAAGCLYEGSEGGEWKNGCHRIDITLDQDGRPLRAEIQFRAWSSRGHWHADSSLYRTQTADGRMVWEAWNGRAGTSRTGDAEADSDDPHAPAERAEERTEAQGRDDARSPPPQSQDEPEPASPGASGTHGAARGRREVDSPAVVTPSAAVDASRRPWDAAVSLVPMLEGGPPVFVEALERALSVSPGAASTRPVRVAQAIDGLGRGPGATKRLLEACLAAWNEVKRRKRPELLRESAKLVRELASEWLPRRYGDGTQVERIDRLRSEADGACLDLAVATSNTIITDVHVAAEDERRLELETRHGSAKGGTPKARWSVPCPMALAAEIKDPVEVADEIAAGFASQFSDVLLDDTPEARRAFMCDHFQLLRAIDEPRYVVVRMKDIPEAVLVALKRIFPPLRIVSLKGSVGGDDGMILQILLHFFKDPDDASGPT